MLSRTSLSLRRKTDRIAALLEQQLGKPGERPRSSDALDMLIATVLSQNTNDKNSHRAYVQLKMTYPTWHHVMKSPTRKLASVIRVSGMANQKSSTIKDVLRTIKKRYGMYSLDHLSSKSNDEVISQLTSFNGVGVKTAACVLVFALGRDVFPVDTHVHRICGRLGLASKSKTPEQTFESMKSLVPPGKAYTFHINLIRFGRKICRSQKPLCSVCPLYAECTFKQKSVFRKLQPSHGAMRDYNFLLMDHV